jgi:hypothetical protein
MLMGERKGNWFDGSEKKKTSKNKKLDLWGYPVVCSEQIPNPLSWGSAVHFSRSKGKLSTLAHRQIQSKHKMKKREAIGIYVMAGN